MSRTPKERLADITEAAVGVRKAAEAPLDQMTVAVAQLMTTEQASGPPAHDASDGSGSGR